MFERYFQEKIEVFNSMSDLNGSSKTLSALPCISETATLNDTGIVKVNAVFFIKTSESLSCGNVIVYQQQKYLINGIKVCRNLSGNIKIYRCSAE